MDAYLLFTTIWFVAAATPGADTMLLLTTSLSAGWKSAIPISIGITLAKVILLLATYYGLSALLDSAPQLFVILKIFGSAFLLWRAFKLWSSSTQITQNSGASFLSNFGLSFSIAISNPQALLFYVAVIPQVSRTTNAFILTLIIAVGFSIISAFYIGLAAPLSKWIQREGRQKIVNRTVAIVFTLLAAVVALR